MNTKLYFRAAIAALASIAIMSCGGSADSGGPASGAPSQVTNVKAAAGSQSATVTWTPPAANPAVTYYAVAQYCSGCASVSPIVTPNQGSLQITGLKANTQYTFAVRAYNGNWGPWSEWAEYVLVK